MERGDLRKAAAILLQQANTLIKEQTEARIVTAEDALAAFPDESEDLARFFEDANRLAYSSAAPTEEEIVTLEAAYLRLAELIG